MAVEIWRMSETRFASLAFSRAPPKDTSTMPAKIPMMAMTTKSSIKVNPAPLFFEKRWGWIKPFCLCIRFLFVIKGNKRPLLFLHYGHAAKEAGIIVMYWLPFSEAANTLPSESRAYTQYSAPAADV